MDEEQWKIIEKFPNYEISSHGKIRNKETKKLFILGTIKDGFYRTSLTNNSKRIEIRVHIAVAETFLDIPEGKYKIKHKDGNKLNNNISNLEIIKLNSQKLGDIDDNHNKDVNIIEQLKKYKIELINDEEFKLIKYFPNHVISSKGRIINIDNGRIISQCTNKKGFNIISLVYGSIRKTYLIHKLVADHFMPNTRVGIWHVIHKNKDKTNNSIGNLEWKKFSKDKIKKITLFDIFSENTDEQWRQIPNYQNYLVSTYGRVLNIKKMKVKKIKTHKSGYVRCTLKNYKGKKKIGIHGLVALAFLPKIEGYHKVNHKNGIKDDNKLSNLEWIDDSGNIKHAWETGLLKISKERYGKEIEQYSLDGIFIKKYKSIAEAAKNLNIDTKKITNDLKNESTLTGYIWEYIEYEQMDGEIWKSVTIPNFGHYSVSNKGRIMNEKKQLLRPGNNDGYRMITLHNGNMNKTITMHILIALVFIDNPKDLPMVNHKDGNRSNNIVENLEWIDNSGNMIHAYETGLFVPFKRKVVQLSMDGELIKIWESITEAQIEGFLDSMICMVCKGKRRQYKGYKWMYHEDYVKLNN